MTWGGGGELCSSEENPATLEQTDDHPALKTFSELAIARASLGEGSGRSAVRGAQLAPGPAALGQEGALRVPGGHPHGWGTLAE